MLLQERHGPLDMAVVDMGGEQSAAAAHAFGIGVPIVVAAEHGIERRHEARRLRRCTGGGSHLVAGILGRKSDIGGGDPGLAQR